MTAAGDEASSRLLAANDTCCLILVGWEADSRTETNENWSDVNEIWSLLLLSINLCRKKLLYEADTHQYCSPILFESYTNSNIFFTFSTTPPPVQAKSLVLAAIVGSATAFAPVSNMATRSVTSLNSVEEQVRNLVKSQLNPDGDFEDSASFMDDLGADSLDAVELIMSLEEEFNIEIPDDEVESITTVQAAIDFVKAAQ